MVYTSDQIRLALNVHQNSYSDFSPVSTEIRNEIHLILDGCENHLLYGNGSYSNMIPLMMESLWKKFDNVTLEKIQLWYWIYIAWNKLWVFKDVFNEEVGHECKKLYTHDKEYTVCLYS